jgi:hypothetical protein
LEIKKQAELDKVIESHQIMTEEREKRIQSEASNLKNESKNMHRKILELQILDKNKRISSSIKRKLIN